MEYVFEIVSYITLAVIAILIIYGWAIRIITYFFPIKFIKITVDGKEGIIDLYSDEPLVRQIERIKEGGK